MYSLQTMTAGIFYPCAENCSLYISVRRRGKNVDSSSKSNPLRRRGKITTRRREGVGVFVEKKKKVDKISTKIRVIYLQQ